jgi:sugar/nucleoside kinase (ribokinase family)
MDEPRLLLAGHVTRDEVEGGVRLGGPPSYCGLAAARLGVPAAVVTVAPPDEPSLRPLRQAGVALHVAPSAVMTTFALRERDGERTLVLKARARSLALGDVPAAVRGLPVAFVGPVAAECDRAFVEGLGARFVGVGLQGWLRTADAGGRVVPALAPEALAPPRVDAAVLSEHDHPEAEAIARRFVETGAIVAITRGARGATIVWREGRVDVPAAPAREVDSTGAGDVFGVVFTLRLAEGEGPLAAAGAAAQAAARVVEGPGIGRL